MDHENNVLLPNPYFRVSQGHNQITAALGATTFTKVMTDRSLVYLFLLSPALFQNARLILLGQSYSHVTR